MSTPYVLLVLHAVSVINLGIVFPFRQTHRFNIGPVLLCNAVACPHLERSGMSTACSRSASAHLYHTDGRLTSCDGAATDCI